MHIVIKARISILCELVTWFKYLKDSLKTESEPVPQSKLSTRGTSNKSSTFRRPLHSFNIDKAYDYKMQLIAVRCLQNIIIIIIITIIIQKFITRAQSHIKHESEARPSHQVARRSVLIVNELGYEMRL